MGIIQIYKINVQLDLPTQFVRVLKFNPEFKPEFWVFFFNSDYCKVMSSLLTSSLNVKLMTIIIIKVLKQVTLC